MLCTQVCILPASCQRINGIIPILIVSLSCEEQPVTMVMITMVMITMVMITITTKTKGVVSLQHTLVWCYTGYLRSVMCSEKFPHLQPVILTDLSLGKHSHEPLPVFGEGDHRGGSPRPLSIFNHFRNLALHHCHTRVGGPKINPNYCPLHLRTAWKDRGKSCDECRSTHSKCRLIPGPSSTFSL